MVVCDVCSWIFACRTSIVIGSKSSGMVFDHSRRRTFSEIVRDLEGDDIIIVSDEEDVADEEADSKRRKVGVAEFFLQSADESDGEDAEEVENDYKDVNHIMSSFRKHRVFQQPGNNGEEKESGAGEFKKVAEDEGSNLNRIYGAGGGDPSEGRTGLMLRKQQGQREGKG